MKEHHMPTPNIPEPGVSSLRDASGSRDKASHEKIGPAASAANKGGAGKSQRVIEVKNRTRTVTLGVAEWVSADGKTYRHRYKDLRNGKMLPDAFNLMNLYMFRELALDPSGSSLRTLLAAYKIQVKDMDGQQMFPITVEMLREARAGHGVVAEEGMDAEIESGSFTIGEEG
jgi:hypothetical protein